ncbi:transposase, partial [Shigella flexneri]
STLKSPSYTKSVSWQHYPASERNKRHCPEYSGQYSLQ